MQFGLLISSALAGVLIILILTVNYNTNYSGTELTMQEVQKQRMASVFETLTYDLPKIGYNLNEKSDTLIRAAGDDFIEFYANIDNSADQSLELIRWEFTSTALSDTPNPNDFRVRRIQDGEVINIDAGIISFEINYYTELGGTTPLATPIYASSSKSTIDSITQIEFIIESESPVKLQYNKSQPGRYVKTSWVKRFSPSNLRSY